MKHLIYKPTWRNSSVEKPWVWECGTSCCNVYNWSKSQPKAMRSLEAHVRRFHG